MIPENKLHEIKQMVGSLLGWDFPSNRRNDLERGVLAMAKELGINDTSEGIISWLSGLSWNDKELDLLASYLTVGETYFFREKPGLDVFREQIIPDILHERQGKDQYMRIWCAGCCTGEEPYTLAILLHEIIPDLQNWKITILGTDINRNFLKNAQAGTYSQWSFRETSQNIKNKYFEHVGKDWRIIPEIKNMVTFSQLNLAEDRYPSAFSNTNHMDVIFCRNVLMYFTPQQIRLVAQRFYQSLTEKGWLIISAVEQNDDYFSEFASLRLEQGIFYRKGTTTTTTTTKTQISSCFNTMPGKMHSPGKPVPVRKSKPPSSIPPKLVSAIPVQKVKEQVNTTWQEVQFLFNHGQYEECVKQCLRLLEKDPLESNTLTLLVKTYANTGNLAEARKWGEILLSQDEIDADSYYLMATILAEGNEAALAESMLKRALYINPNHLLSYFLMGNIISRQGTNSSAARYYQNVIELLAGFQEDDVVPGSEGLSAGRMKEIAETLVHNLSPGPQPRSSVRGRWPASPEPIT